MQHALRDNPGARAAIPLALACALLACPGTDSTVVSTTTDSTATGSTDTDPVAVTERVIAWTQGAIDRGPRPRGSNMRVLALPAGQPIAEGVPRSPCMRATTFLPGPPRDPRIFLLVDHRLVVQDPRSADPAPASGPASGPDHPDRPVEVAMPAAFPAMRVERLLAFSRVGTPVELLVTARPDPGTPAGLWILAIRDTAVVQARPADPAAVSTREALFARFDAPRCKHRDRRCLRLDRLDGETSIDEQSVAGGSQHRVQNLGEVEVGDAAWAGTEAGDTTLYLLTRCTAQDG